MELIFTPPVALYAFISKEGLVELLTVSSAPFKVILAPVNSLEL